MKLLLSVPIVLLLAFSFTGCSDPVTPTTIRDTTYISVPTGPALVRFVSMYPDGRSAFVLKLTSNPDDPGFVSTGSGTQPYYLPLVPDSDARYYVFFNSQLVDSIVLSGKQLPDASINTFALSWRISSNGNPSINTNGGVNNDSLKWKPIPRGYARIRFINGVDYLSSMSLALDNVSNPLDTIPFSELSGYADVPAGKHQLLVIPTGFTQVLSSYNEILDSGGYYTARYVGIHGDATNPDHLVVDAE
ncbi:MAG: hypothetical protein Q8922_03900 [Bacteroidota bacterium]|nr:hypothetical protein [Bacteroidota bacterium]MDP4233437.1 hypothetical protein [Bacteroidota bacterium]MDP4242303.1 hypothetical protein [Bacteroidota bacterium]MDP4287059.1 hypothetical protein [Bacteroidota bacterium]